MDTLKLTFTSLTLLSIGFLSLTEGQRVVINPPEVNVKKFVNDSYFVSCQPPQATWYNPKNVKVDTSAHSRIYVENDSGYGTELFLTRITTGDAGTYTCTFKNSKASFNLSVIRPIIFDMSLEEQSGEEGKPYTIRCKAEGQNIPKITWKVDQKSITGNNAKYQIVKEGLRIINVQPEDANKTYMCSAIDYVSQIPDRKSMKINLKVKMKPRAMRGAHAKVEHWGVLGEWANLTCSAFAEPPPKFDWYHGEKKLRGSDEIFIINDPNMSTLQVLVRGESKFGAYKCTAHNDLGTYERVLQLKKAKKPPTPTLEQELVGTDAAKIRVKHVTPRLSDVGDRNDKGGKDLPPTGYVVQYKMATRGDWLTANVSRYDGGFILAGLTPKITYNVRAAIKNQATVGEFSPPIRIVTPESSPWRISGGHVFGAGAALQLLALLPAILAM